jgi:hypothetical protein
MEEYKRIMHNAAVMPGYNGTTTAAVVDKILDICGGQIFCNGALRDFVFTPITKNHYRFHTEDWYEKTYGRN